MSKLQRFDEKLVKAGLTTEQRMAVVSALNEYMNEYLEECSGQQSTEGVAK